MDLETIILSEGKQRKTSIIMTSHTWNLKNNTNELIYKTETDSQRKQTYGYQRGKREGNKLRVLNNRYTSLY